MIWANIYDSNLIDENLVPGIHLIEMLEKDSKYHTVTTNYFSRIKNSLKYIPTEFHEAAVALFANVVYIPELILNESLSFFWAKHKREYFPEIIDEDELLLMNHFFEVDPSGLINKFCHQNGIQQRLHPEHFIRIPDVYTIRDVLLKLLYTKDYVQKEAFEILRRLSKKKYWNIFTDKVLSGQSLFKDLEKYIKLRELLYTSFKTESIINVFAQIITSDALKYGEEILSENEFLKIDFGLFFDETMKVNSVSCQLFNHPDIQQEVYKLCEWFSETILSKDKEKYNRMRQKSGDDLRFGYRSCGLTLVDHSNCPTNSLPLLWYDNSNYFNRLDIPEYQGPYPRVHSRLGEQKIEPSQDEWQDLENSFNKIIEIIKKLDND